MERRKGGKLLVYGFDISLCWPNELHTIKLDWLVLIPGADLLIKETVVLLWYHV